MIHIPNEISEKSTILSGSQHWISNKPVPIFDKGRISFLADLSRQLLADIDVRNMPDVVSFAYWCRQANLSRLAQNRTPCKNLRIGLGLSFHICPSNVPINSAFSMAFGLLSGNACAIRLPSKDSPTLRVLVKAISKLLCEKRYEYLTDYLILMRFERDDLLNKFWMSVADGKIIWGGDNTLEQIRSFKSKPRSREVAFPDRYSICVINPNSINSLNASELRKLCEELFNDLYLMDQAACSSPQLLVWVGSESLVEEAKKKLWPAMLNMAKSRYSITPVQVIDKFVQACLHTENNPNVVNIKRHENILYRLELSGLQLSQEKYRGYFGLIHEISFENFEFLAEIVNEKYQTLTYFGIDPMIIRKNILEQRLRGIDRVVPIGKALDMDLIWDGYNIVDSLSREINFQ